MQNFQSLSPDHGKRQNVLSSGAMQLGTSHFEDLWKFSSLLYDNQLFMTTPVIDKPVLIDVQGLLLHHANVTLIYEL